MKDIGLKLKEKREEKFNTTFVWSSPVRDREVEPREGGRRHGSLLCDACHPGEGRCEGQRCAPSSCLGHCFFGDSAAGQ